MIIRACAFTTEGWKLIDQLEQGLTMHCFERRDKEQELSDWIEEGFRYSVPILFVGAIGIAVRKIAPYVDNKLTDSPVIVADEAGHFVVPLLSDHVGGAGELAAQIAKVAGAQIVVTAATDIRGGFSVDVFARKNGLLITDKDGIKRVSSRLLENGSITMAIESSIEYKDEDIPECIRIVQYGSNYADVIIEDCNLDGLQGENQQGEGVQGKELPGKDNYLLKLIYKPFVLGVGCKKNTEFEKIDRFIKGVLSDNSIDISMVRNMASIDIKGNERGLLFFEAQNRIPFMTFSSEELLKVEGTFAESEFVKSVTGVSNVCETAAMKCAGDNASLIVGKTARDGMTLAVSKRKARIDTWET